MGKGRFLVEAHLLEGCPVLELAAEHGVHFSWIYHLSPATARRRRRDYHPQSLGWTSTMT